MILNGLVHLVSSLDFDMQLWSYCLTLPHHSNRHWQELVEMAIQKMTAWQSYRRVHRLSPEPRTQLVGEMLVKYRGKKP